MKRIDVMATTISGSIADWKKVERIVPLFAEHGYRDVRLHKVDSHAAARAAACTALKEGGRIPISAGGSGTFRAVLEGCIDSGIELDQQVRAALVGRRGHFLDALDRAELVLHRPDQQALRVLWRIDLGDGRLSRRTAHRGLRRRVEAGRARLGSRRASRRFGAHPHRLLQRSGEVSGDFPGD